METLRAARSCLIAAFAMAVLSTAAVAPQDGPPAINILEFLP
jgi:hypothetical protein